MKEVDVRGYPPCEPMEMALEAASSLKDSDKVKIIHNQIPYPLFEVLKNRGFSYILEEKGADLFHIIIKKGS